MLTAAGRLGSRLGEEGDMPAQGGLVGLESEWMLPAAATAMLVAG